MEDFKQDRIDFIDIYWFLRLVSYILYVEDFMNILTKAPKSQFGDFSRLNMISSTHTYNWKFRRIKRKHENKFLTFWACFFNISDENFTGNFVFFTGPSEKNLGLVKKTSQPMKKTVVFFHVWKKLEFSFTREKNLSFFHGLTCFFH